ncbi:MAG TPA: hypothetical protein VMR54_12520 [Thermoanaerobaculia bacterium]|nr:hypothetical protein [Thermoanaerobaculia bacterium]
MMTIEDFTQLPEGSVVLLEGTVVRCPRCGRNGVLKNPYDGRSSCIHAEESTILGDGMLTEPTDSCELPEA